MKKTMINGREFEVVSGCKAKQEIIEDVNRTNLVSIFDIYGRPSYTKIDIYNTWCKWFDGLNVSGLFGCMRGGSSTFSIGARYETPDGQTIYLYITKEHNRIVYA